MDKNATFLVALALAGCSPAVVSSVVADAGDASNDAPAQGDGGDSGPGPSDATSEGPPPTEAGPDATLPDGAVSPQRACSDSAYGKCTKLKGCSETELGIIYGSFGECQAIFDLVCLNAINAPSSGSTPATVAMCTAALPGWSCTDFISGANPPPECRTQAGTLPNGAPCATASQCQTAYCGLPNGLSCGTCMPVPTAPASCASLICPQGSFCFRASMECVANALENQPCGQDQPCAAQLTCVAGVCTPAAQGLGMPCSPNGAGCSLYDGLSCNAATNACAAERLAAPGEACGVVGNQAASCAAGDCVRGACVPTPAPGEACDLNGVGCGANVRCIVGSSSLDGGTAGTCRVSGGGTCP